MKYQFLPQMEAYDGSQLRSLFTYMKTELPGNSLTAWMGPCDIPSDKIVDGEDLLANSEIRGSKMLHFICEKFNSSLAEMVGLQRIFAALSIEVLEEFIGKRQDFVRKGDDVFYKEV